MPRTSRQAASDSLLEACKSDSEVGSLIGSERAGNVQEHLGNMAWLLGEGKGVRG